MSNRHERILKTIWLRYTLLNDIYQERDIIQIKYLPEPTVVRRLSWGVAQNPSQTIRETTNAAQSLGDNDLRNAIERFIIVSKVNELLRHNSLCRSSSGEYLIVDLLLEAPHPGADAVKERVFIELLAGSLVVLTSVLQRIRIANSPDSSACAHSLAFRGIGALRAQSMLKTPGP